MTLQIKLGSRANHVFHIMKLCRSVRLPVLGVLLGVFGFAVVSAYFARELTSPPRKAVRTDLENYFSEFEPVRFSASDGVALSAWFVPCPGAKEAVVLLHGSGGSRNQMLARARLLHDHGFAVLLYDARGCGESGGEFISFGWYETRDLLAALDWLRARGFSRFGLIGASQGGATIALAAAELRDVRWAVLESVYPTLLNAVDRRFRQNYGVPGWLGGALLVPFAERRIDEKARNISPRDAIEKLSCPVFVMSGVADQHTLASDARQVFDHAPEPKTWWLVPGAQHVDLHGFAKDEYEKRLLEFIAKSSKE